jgi:hypothetical protein
MYDLQMAMGNMAATEENAPFQMLSPTFLRASAKER